MSRLGAALILALSRKPGTSDLNTSAAKSEESALRLLRRVYPDFDRWIQGNRVLDFGCGAGLQSTAIWRAGAREVVGLDTNVNVLKRAEQFAVESGALGPVRFATELSENLKHSFDIVISQNAMEHFPQPETVLEAMKMCLRPGGRLLITFGPPWFAPYGSHMHFFTRIPWVNILFSEDSVMRARSEFRSDGARRYEDVESGLNKMSVSRFDRMIATHELKADFVKYDCIKGIDWLGKIPALRELFINHISVSARLPNY